MGVLGAALRDGRLAVWNDLWGYGFPGLAESQMGVFYPVHVILYRWLNTETAYVASLVAHTLWGGLGAYWAARGWRSRRGSALAAFSWTTCGFFVVHLANPWGYTTGCWMPWAWGLTWCMFADGSSARPAAPFLLSLVLVLQVLPGHFQLAFQTQLGIGVMVFWVMIKCWRARSRGRIATGPADASSSLAARPRSCWRLPRSSPWRPCSSCRRTGSPDWRKASVISNTCPGLRQHRCIWSIMLPPGYFIVHRSGDRWSGTRFMRCPRNIWPTSGWHPCFWPASRSSGSGVAMPRFAF